MTIVDLNKLSERVLIGIADTITNRVATMEVTEAKNAFYPFIGTMNAVDLDLYDAVLEELEQRGNGGYRWCSEHLLPLIAPDGCERCAGLDDPDPFVWKLRIFKESGEEWDDISGDTSTDESNLRDALMRYASFLGLSITFHSKLRLRAGKLTDADGKPKGFFRILQVFPLSEVI